jgi:hypothetical protein
MARETRFFVTVSVLGMFACTPLASELDDYSRDWEPIPSDPMSTSSALPSESPPPPASEAPVDPGTGEIPIDVPLDNPDSSNTSDDTDTGEPSDPDPEPDPTTVPEPDPTTVPEPDPTPVAPAPCTDGITDEDNGVCYFVSTTYMVWNDARLACDAWGGTLAQLDTPQEDFLVGGLVADSLWIGASDTVTDGVFLWIDLHPVTFGNWGPGQPDAFVGAECVVKRQDAGEQWYAQSCNEFHPFVCERSLVP